MRDDQYAKLKGLTEKLTDVVIVEADPEAWPGDPAKLAELTREERGDRYWCKKNAAATLSVLMRVYNLVGVIERDQRGGDLPPPAAEGETDLDREVKEAEKEAQAILKKIQNRGRAPAR